MANPAAFTISSTPSEDPITGDRGYLATTSETLTLQLESQPSLDAQKTTYSVFDAAIENSPLASKSMPTITFTTSGVSTESPSDPAGPSQIQVPSSGAHSFIIRCRVDTAAGSYTFEREVSILSPQSLRKTVPAEQTQFAARGWSDDQNDMVDAITTLVTSLPTVKLPVRVATTANITLSGNQTIDGVLTSNGDRVLVKDQSVGSENGIYIADAGAWARATDFDESSEVFGGILVSVSEGSANGNMTFQLATDDPITLDTTSLQFILITSGVSLAVALMNGNITGGTNIDVSAGDAIDFLGEIDIRRQTVSYISTTAGALTALTPDDATSPQNITMQAGSATSGNNNGAKVGIFSGAGFGTGVAGAIELGVAATALVTLSTATAFGPGFVMSGDVSDPSITVGQPTASGAGPNLVIRAGIANTTGDGGTLRLGAGNDGGGTGLDGRVEIFDADGNPQFEFISEVSGGNVGRVFAFFGGTSLTSTELPAATGDQLVWFPHATQILGEVSAGGTNRVLLDWGTNTTNTLLIGDQNHDVALRGSTIEFFSGANSQLKITNLTFNWTGVATSGMNFQLDGITVLGFDRSGSTRNVAVFADKGTNFNSGDRVLFIADRIAEPSTTATGGSYLWSAGGVLTSNHSLAVGGLAATLPATGTFRFPHDSTFASKSSVGDDRVLFDWGATTPDTLLVGSSSHNTQLHFSGTLGIHRSSVLIAEFDSVGLDFSASGGQAIQKNGESQIALYRNGAQRAIGFFTGTTDVYNGGDDIVFVADRATEPSTTATGGSYFWSASGAITTNHSWYAQHTTGGNIGAKLVNTEAPVSGGVRSPAFRLQSEAHDGSVSRETEWSLTSSPSGDVDPVIAQLIWSTRVENGHGFTDVLSFRDDPGSSLVRISSIGSIDLHHNVATGRSHVWAINAVAAQTLTAAALQLSVPAFSFESTQATPSISHQADSGADATGDDMTILAQSVTGSGTTVTAGDLRLSAGSAAAATATNKVGGNVQIIRPTGGTVVGNISLGIDNSSWQSMEGGLHVGDVTTLPTGNPSGGSFFGSDLGAGFWRGSTGFFTELTADGHAGTFVRRSNQATSTLGQTNVTLLTYTPPNDSSGVGRAWVVAHDATANETNSYAIYFSWRKSGSTLTAFSASASATYEQEEDASWSCQVTQSGNDIIVQAPATDASNSVTWDSYIEALVQTN